MMLPKATTLRVDSDTMHMYSNVASSYPRRMIFEEPFRFQELPEEPRIMAY